MKYISNAAITLDEQGKVLTREEAEKRIKNDKEAHVDWYFDPFCPFCVKLDQLTKAELPQILKENKALITYHLVTFLNERTTNNYSDKAAGFMLGVGEIRGDLFYAFMHGIMNDEFHPTPVLERKNEDFKALFEGLGGTAEEWEKILTLAPNFIPDAHEQTTWFFSDAQLAKKSPLNGETFVPFILVNDGEEAFNVHKADTFKEFMQAQF